MRTNPRPAASAGNLPRSGDIVSCDGCGRVSVHARQLALSACCGRRARILERDAPTTSLATRFGRAMRALVGRGSTT